MAPDWVVHNWRLSYTAHNHKRLLSDIPHVAKQTHACWFLVSDTMQKLQQFLLFRKGGIFIGARQKGFRRILSAYCTNSKQSRFVRTWNLAKDILSSRNPGYLRCACKGQNFWGRTVHGEIHTEVTLNSWPSYSAPCSLLREIHFHRYGGYNETLCKSIALK